MDRQRRIAMVFVVLTIIFTFFGSTLAYLNWQTSDSQKTNIVFKLEQDFWCAADGGGDIDESDTFMVPTTCTNENHAIQREVVVTPTIHRNDLSITTELFLDIDKIDSGLSNSDNFKYALTTNSNSCTDGVISSGTFKGKHTGDQVRILSQNYSSSTPVKYYLYIWLDAAETSPSTMDQSFSLSMSGDCFDEVEPEQPVIDEGMIPVTLSSSGTVTTIQPGDPDWYDYDNKEWANVVLVDNDSRSTYQDTSGVTVNQSDILAYYVWIPRYRYRIPQTQCSSIANPTIMSNPSCYDTPYNMSDINKSYLISWWQELVVNMVGLTTYTQEEATAAINEGLSTGTLTLTIDGQSESMPMLEFLFEMYTNGYEYEISESNKVSLATYLYTLISAEDSTYTQEAATEDIDAAIHSGIIHVNAEPIISLEEGIAMYNEENSANITYTTKQLISANFNGSNTISSDGNPTQIDIEFESTSSTMKMGDAVNTYRTHPAFWWDDDSDGTVDSGETMSGIWVGKFETSANTDSTCYTSNSEANCVASNVSPRILPNVKSLRYQNVSTQFTTSQLFSDDGNIYGLSNTSTNAHMMKNSEWGAVAYLSHSAYGINHEIRINNNYNFTTGCGASAENGSLTSSCEISYNASSTPQSTTGNITGIYDMSGGAWEYVMGVLADNSGNPRSGYNSSYNSGYNGLLSDDTSYTVGLNFPTSKYYDLYISENSLTACNGGICYGHALSETANWYNDYADFVYSLGPWFLRGGYYNNGASAGTWGSTYNNGVAHNNFSWRSVLSVGYGA